MSNAEKVNYTKEFTGTIERCRVMMGVTTPIPPEMYKIFWEVCETGFKDFSHQEIDKAFRLLVVDKLPEANREHYNNFSVAYLGNILAAYRKYRRTQINKQEKDFKKKEEMREPTKSELKKARHDYLDLLEKKIKHLYNTGVITFDEVEGMFILNEVSRLKLIDWSKYMEAGKLRKDIEEEAMQEVRNEIEALKSDLSKRFEIRRLIEKLDLHLSGATVQDIESKKRAYASKIVLLDWLQDKENWDRFISIYRNEHN